MNTTKIPPVVPWRSLYGVGAMPDRTEQIAAERIDTLARVRGLLPATIGQMLFALMDSDDSETNRRKRDFVYDAVAELRNASEISVSCHQCGYEVWAKS